MSRHKQTSAEQKLQKLRTNKIKRNWFIKQEHIAFISTYAKRYNIPQAEALRRILDFVMSISEEYINERIRKV